jgi:hypothetical protein
VRLGVALRSLGEVAAADSDGPGPTEAAEHLKRSIAIFEDIGNDVELARTCRTYADLLRRLPEHATSAALAAEAKELAVRAEDIFAKMRAIGSQGGAIA